MTLFRGAFLHSALLLTAGEPDGAYIPTSASFGDWLFDALLPEVFVVEDTLQDPRCAACLGTVACLGSALPCQPSGLCDCLLPCRPSLSQAASQSPRCLDTCSQLCMNYETSLLGSLQAEASSSLIYVACRCRFEGHKAVTEPPYLRFYAAAPIVASTGQRLGAL